jgi:hypothetical protein
MIWLNLAQKQKKRHSLGESRYSARGVALQLAIERGFSYDVYLLK